MTAKETKKVRNELKVLGAISNGHRTLAALKKATRKDQRATATALVKDGSLEKQAEVGYVLTKRGAGRLRFIPTAIAG